MSFCQKEDIDHVLGNHKGRDTPGDKSLRHVAGTSRRKQIALCDMVNFMKIIVAAAEFCRRDQSHEFKPV